MNYPDGSSVSLGDIVRIPVSGGTSRARVVMLGDSYQHLELDEAFLAWVKMDRVLEATHVVVEWLDPNPFAHDDPRYAPVGNYMFTQLDECVERDA